ncbi:MAG: disulfide bond formation protein DsbA [Candidatus Ryanbacteria bacterium CG10_big_fil_rev_8_21_14_0_10_43_42]|uniref:Disulfide bond formation protein DsbA n=1 Tax=Candidatus Ryanbacteria bacterium CG10_big_fil_rev_8_21_14_0_10_43_42 TaxID=1974864 RepID=A0A2M8KWP3_9BACT|nr:MAG: disulfide bond formation protein DsbA [Candidatus Ryanbacteria bacterium CG10_big_fil_rev_8_21_14_0_10_43_42]
MQESHNPYVIPLSIIVAGVLIAGAIMYAGDGGGFVAQTDTTNPKDGTESGNEQAVTGDVKSVTGEDHILGNPDAPIKLVEYSDLECPFCSRFHATMKQVMDEYGKDGQVAWVYRHFPLSQIHPSANEAAQASECANELGGNDGFWAYIDEVFLRQDQGLSTSMLLAVAEDIGLDRPAFESCLSSGTYAESVQRSFEDARTAGGTGTPYTVVVVDGDTFTPINGALPFAQVSSVIESALAR